jgi:sugar phosphate isomerase/epimerase
MLENMFKVIWYRLQKELRVVKNRLIPSLLIPEIYFPEKEKEGISSYLIEKYALEGFYQSYEISDIRDSKERKQIARLVENHKIQLTQWLPSLINREKLDLSSLNSKKRYDSIQIIKENLYLASECGANSVALISGKDPGASCRDSALKVMFESLSEICDEANKFKITILIEPIDYKTSKNGLLGSVSLVSEMIERLKLTYKNIGLVFDTAHSALNEENIFNALEVTKSHIRGIHLSNAVLDKKSHLYGDNHIPIGEPGFLTENLITQFLCKAGELLNDQVNVAIEVRSRSSEECLSVEQNVRTIFKTALIS